MRRSTPFLARALAAVVAATAVPDALAGSCDSVGPDVIVGGLDGILRWGTVGNVTGYSIGTTSCNIGDVPANWVASTVNHPVIAQNLYRYKDGRFEQIGLSWVKHGFAALSESLCCSCEFPPDGTTLGVGCSDPYLASTNGDQGGVAGCGGACGGLGPRSQVNAATGWFVHPYAFAGDTGNFIFKRLQVHNADVDPALNAGAVYYGEGQYVTIDDAAAGNQQNNASYRRATVGSFVSGGWNLALAGATTQQLAAIYAWQVQDPSVVIETVDDLADGRMHLGSRVTDNGNGTWHYEYALHNQTSHRSAGRFAVPIPAGVTVTNIGFHDVDYHSGEPYVGTDWPGQIAGGWLSWACAPYDEVDDTANALRWGTLYNFRFDADSPPAAALAVIGLHRPGAPPAATVAAPAPQGSPCPWDLDGDGLVSIVDLLGLLGAWGSNPGGPPDFDGNGSVGITDLLELLSVWGPCPGGGPCGDRNAGSCFQVNATPACSDAACCQTICALDPLCCDVVWDGACVNLALVQCGNCGLASEGDCCVADATPGCADPDCCTAVCFADPFCCEGAWDELCVEAALAMCKCP